MAAGTGPRRSPLHSCSDDGPDRALALANDGQEPLGPLNGLVLVSALHHCPAADKLLGLGERAVQNGELAAVVLHLDRLAQRPNPAGRQQDARLRRLFHELTHPLVQLRLGLSDWRVRVSEGVTEEPHLTLLPGLSRPGVADRLSPERRTGRPQFDMARRNFWRQRRAVPSRQRQLAQKVSQNPCATRTPTARS